jgi:hypothetical protein
MDSTAPSERSRKLNCIAMVITAVGFLQMCGYFAKFSALRGVAAATCASPLPKVFSDVEGLETFASTFEITGMDGEGYPFSIVITPEVYSRLQGSYNRRNVYGAALSYGPRLPERLWQQVFRYGFSPEGPLRKEIGVPAEARDLAVVIRTKTRGRTESWILRAP